MVAQNAVADFDPDRLRQERARAGLTQRGLEDLAGLPRGVVAMYEGGFRGPGIARLQRLAEALAIGPDGLTSSDRMDTLARLRIQAGFTQADAAQAAGLVRTTYSALERGEHASMAADVAARIAEAFGVSVSLIQTAHSQAVADRLAQL